jgi:hypothetical protein
MGRDTSIYMIDEGKATTHLYNDLLHKVYHTGTFKKFIEDRRKEFNDDYMNYYSILEVIKKDAHLLTAEDLFEITLFLRKQTFHLTPRDHNDTIQSLYNFYGIIELFMIPHTTVCSAYMFQYGNYTYYFPFDELKNDFGVNIKAEDFLRFNDYVILVMKKILESNLNDDYDYHLSEEEEKIVDSIKIENQGNSLLFEIIENELNFLIEMSATDNDGPYSQTIYNAYNFLITSIEMKARIDIEKKIRIIIVDTY